MFHYYYYVSEFLHRKYSPHTRTIQLTRSDKGRLSEEEIERMIREAEEFADEDRKGKEHILTIIPIVNTKI